MIKGSREISFPTPCLFLVRHQYCLLGRGLSLFKALCVDLVGVVIRSLCLWIVFWSPALALDLETLIQCSDIPFDARCNTHGLVVN